MSNNLNREFIEKYTILSWWSFYPVNIEWNSKKKESLIFNNRIHSTLIHRLHIIKDENKFKTIRIELETLISNNGKNFIKKFKFKKNI